MQTLILTLAVLAVFILAMSVGVIMGRKPIKGSCGGVGAACLVGYVFLAGFAHLLLDKPQMKNRADLSCGVCLLALGAVLGWTR